jgi:hypothetical protein
MNRVQVFVFEVFMSWCASGVAYFMFWDSRRTHNKNMFLKILVMLWTWILTIYKRVSLKDEIFYSNIIIFFITVDTKLGNEFSTLSSLFL